MNTGGGDREILITANTEYRGAGWNYSEYGCREIPIIVNMGVEGGGKSGIQIPIIGNIVEEYMVKVYI